MIGNVGDSRAVLGMRDKGDSLVPIQLTVDLKPNLPGFFLYHFNLLYSEFCFVIEALHCS